MPVRTAENPLSGLAVRDGYMTEVTVGQLVGIWRMPLLSRENRPWPVPDRPWVMKQVWHDLLFAHWPVEAAALRSLIPPALELETFDGAAWLGIIPFRMTGVTPRWVPPLPWFSAFLELNVRTYVSDGTKPGVWFFSLDAANSFAVAAGRRLFSLPYYRA